MPPPAPTVSRSQPHSSLPRRRKRARNVLQSVLYTLLFHVAALLFGVALLLLLVLTLGGVGLLLLCICSGSSRSVRVLVASLWRTELWINALGVDDAKRANDAAAAADPRSSRAHFEAMARVAIGAPAAPPPSSTTTTRSGHPAAAPGSVDRAPSRPRFGAAAQRGREVTTSVMVLSLLYFLLFKWLFNVIFSAVPLAFWSIAIAQFVPADGAAGVNWDLSGGSTKYFVGVAVGFLAHQIAVTAAVASVSVSEKMAGFLFEEANRAEDREHAPLLHWHAAEQGDLPPHAYQYQSGTDGAHSVFDARAYATHHASPDARPYDELSRAPLASSQSLPPPFQGSFNSRLDDRRRLSAGASAFDPRAARAAPSAPETHGPDPCAGGVPPLQPGSSRMPYPPMPPMPQMPSIPPFGSDTSDVEAAYREQTQERVVDCCMFKVHIKHSNDSGDDPHSGGHGGGRGSGHGFGRGGGRGGGGRGGRGGGRGDFGFRMPGMGGPFFPPGVDPTARGPHVGGFPDDPRLAAHNHRSLDGHHKDPRCEWLSKKKGGRHELKRTKSFDSLCIHTGLDELPPHMRVCEVLDLSPSAPPLHSTFSTRSDRVSRSSADVPIARLADDYADTGGVDPRYRPSAASLQMRKSNLDEGRYPGGAAAFHPQSPTSYLREREVYAKDRDFYHDGIAQAVLDGIAQAKIEAKQLAALGGASTSTTATATPGPRVIRRPVSSGSSSVRDVSAPATDTQLLPRDDARRISFTGPYQAGAGSNDLNDLEISGQFGSLPQTFEEYNYLDVFRLPGQSSSETIAGLSDVPMFRGGLGSGPEYSSFTPPASPTSTANGSFLVNTASYDLYSPTNSVQHEDDDDFPSDQLPQVYRSIQYSCPPAMAHSRFSEYDDVPGRRDKVHFNAFAPPSVAPSPKLFHYTVWAFLLNQRAEMRERAETFDPASRKLSVDTKLDIRRGALVHVTLDTPEGFRILNGATQGFSWEGKVCSATFDVQCTDGAAFGSVLFKATIIVGTEVAILRSYVSVSSKQLEPADLEAQMLSSKLEVLEKTFEEIPYKSLEMKELVGSGHFGDAYRATYNGRDVVVKTIRASEFGETSEQIVQEFQHEAAVLNMFGHHPCVVPFVGASTDIRFPLSIVTAYLPFGSLEDNLRAQSTDPGSDAFTIGQKTAMLKDAAAGLLNIHEGGFIHRDIAARNCLVDDSLRVKICDFGLCRRVSASGGTLMKDGVGPVKYMAPESLLPPHLFSYESDSYMFGVLMWETFTMSTPFAALSPLEAVLKVMNGERLAVPQDLPETLRSLMETCFHDSPTQRPSMVEILATLDELSSSARARVSSATSSGASSSATIGAATAAASAYLSSATKLRADRSSIWV
ncbi:hypothetical protein PybrP1_001536 [[Pythium] brassicae (nom. inval.)]|nr:hypothetical protein PybrP1_001536 [[Pythium] brassicae (nom. inval.)]